MTIEEQSSSPLWLAPDTLPVIALVLALLFVLLIVGQTRLVKEKLIFN